MAWVKGGGYLPDSAEIVEDYDPEFIRRFGLGDPEYRKPFEPLNRHGREMAQIVWSVTGSKPGGPKFYLLNANGPTMLRRAVRYAIEKQVDVILFSGSFEGGGSGDGKGPIDRVVDKAVARGILWINAAGNYGGRVYNGLVRVLSDGYLKLRNVSDIAALRFRNRADENTITVTLTWNDYKDEEDAGTDKDLDLFVEDWTGRRVGSGEKIQVSGSKVAGPDESRNPRERVVLADLPKNPHIPTDPDFCYRIRVKARRGRFSAGDRIRILLTPTRDTYIPAGGLEPEEAVTFVDASNEGEIYPPADNPGVLTVGEAGPSSSVGPTLDGRAKPRRGGRGFAGLFHRRPGDLRLVERRRVSRWGRRDPQGRRAEPATESPPPARPRMRPAEGKPQRAQIQRPTRDPTQAHPPGMEGPDPRQAHPGRPGKLKVRGMEPRRHQVRQGKREPRGHNIKILIIDNF